MLYRLRKQVSILFVVFLFLALVMTGVYYAFLKPAPTCFDNIKNQDEEEIDCGGTSCIACEIKTLKQVEVTWAQLIPLGQNTYDLAAKIKNPNPNFGTTYVNYEFMLYSSSDRNARLFLAFHSNPEHAIPPFWLAW